MYKLQFSEIALDDIEYFKASTPAVRKKISELLEEIQQHPETGTGRPEKLRYSLSGCMSRRISLKDRLVYAINEDKQIVQILSLRGHY